MNILTDEQIQAKLAALDTGAGAAASTAAPPVRTRKHQYVTPLTAHADSLISALRIDDGIGLGLGEVDLLTRGFRPSDFVIITGFAHSGKTQLVNTMIMLNQGKHVLFFSLDDPAEMILAKLVAMFTNIPSEQLEARVRAGDEGIKQTIREAAANTFKNLLVVDQQIGINAMQIAVEEAAETWGQQPDAVVIDYLEMMPGSGVSDDNDGANIKAKANSLKAWAKHAAFPVICLHQGTRSNAKPGEPITLLSMGHSGEQQATIVVGCRRKRDRTDLEPCDRMAVENTITVHVVKNKRPGGRCTHFEGIDFHLDAPTGLIRPLNERESNRIFDPNSAAARQEAAALSSLGATVEYEQEPF